MEKIQETKKCNDHNRDAVGHNPLCGDKVRIFLKLDENKVLQDITFLGEGCAISMASASIMTEILKSKDFNVAKKNFRAIFTDDDQRRGKN